MTMRYIVRFRDPKLREADMELGIHQYKVLHVIYHFISPVEDFFPGIFDPNTTVDSQERRYKMLTRLAAAYLDGILTHARNYGDPNPLIDLVVRFGKHETSLPPEDVVFADELARGGRSKEWVLNSPENSNRYLKNAASILTDVLDCELPTLDQVQIAEDRRKSIRPKEAGV